WCGRVRRGPDLRRTLFVPPVDAGALDGVGRSGRDACAGRPPRRRPRLREVRKSRLAPECELGVEAVLRRQADLRAVAQEPEARSGRLSGRGGLERTEEAG